ncbi:MAG: helix-turn-helix domain-containing protein [Oscillospiraceae bacterium]|nr:helix-turn-helix domain-containing protein [Oscillospiraceae bacterium]
MLPTKEAYEVLFPDYPDVVTVKQMCEMLGGISMKTGYRLLHSGEVKSFNIGRSIRIPKISLIDYLAVAEKYTK